MKLSIDLKRNPDIGALISDMSMGDGVCFCTTLKSRDENLAEFTLEKAVETPEDLKDSDVDDEEEESDDEAVVDGDEMKRHSKMPAPGGSKNTPGGSEEQDKLSAALAAQI